MSKAHRGTGLRKTVNHGRGLCPICKNPNIKVVYEYDLDGKKVMICKFCKAHLKNKARLEKPAASFAFLSTTKKSPTARLRNWREKSPSKSKATCAILAA